MRRPEPPYVDVAEVLPPTYAVASAMMMAPFALPRGSSVRRWW
ncbi:hypothetical protein [Nonomuraea sp. JJY05]|jgi:hypothetical protein